MINDSPEDDPSGGPSILADLFTGAVSDKVSMHERIAATVAPGTDFVVVFAFVLILFNGVDCASLVGVRLRKLTRFKND